ncbi:hypothetical protein B0H12DRAFT_1011853 [Mycena haematopus]|nr:hypothetical protein B0H12DRAFT_1011853 [Mycena haematopus]
MHSSSISFFVTLALALSAASSPVALNRNNADVYVLILCGYATGGPTEFGLSSDLRSDAPQSRVVAENELDAREQDRRSQAKGGKKGGKGATAKATTAKAATVKAVGTTAASPAAPSKAVAAPPAELSTDPKALQSSTTLDPAVIQTTDDGQNPPVTGQSAADTSPNNFANLCALGLPEVPLTNGLQITTGSCNPIPIGNIPSVDNMPSSKFQTPRNLDTVASDETFTITLATQGIQLGTFTNAQKTYFGNPQKLNAQGQIVGHTHIVMESIGSLTTTELTNPKDFVFFKGVDDAQDGDGNVAVPVTGGVPPGAYRMCTIVSSATHQPAIVPVAQHGSLDDCIYVSFLLLLFCCVVADGRIRRSSPLLPEVFPLTLCLQLRLRLHFQPQLREEPQKLPHQAARRQRPVPRQR